jgi:hypothetical protein
MKCEYFADDENDFKCHNVFCLKTQKIFNKLTNRCKSSDEKKTYLIDGIVGWTLSEVEFTKEDVTFTFTKPGWYRKKVKVQSGSYDGEIDVLIDEWYAVEAGVKNHY